jgi:hypothetical protein
MNFSSVQRIREVAVGDEGDGELSIDLSGTLSLVK